MTIPSPPEWKEADMPRVSRTSRFAAVAVVVLTLLGCGGSGSDDVSPSAPPPSASPSATTSAPTCAVPSSATGNVTAGRVVDTQYDKLPTWQTNPDPLAFSLRTFGYLRQLAAQTKVPPGQDTLCYLVGTGDGVITCGGSMYANESAGLKSGHSRSAYSVCHEAKPVLIILPPSVQSLWDQTRDSLRMSVIIMQDYGNTLQEPVGRCAIGAYLKTLQQIGDITAKQAEAQINWYNRRYQATIRHGYNQGCTG